MSNPVMNDMVNLVFGALPNLEFRHHGLGVLQAYISPIHRVHLWHPDLRADWTADPIRAVHDHRYDISSQVLVGSIVDVSYEVWPHNAWPDTSFWSRFAPVDTLKTTSLWTIVNAKAQKARGLADDECAGLIGWVATRETGRRRFSQGDTYFIPRRAFHSTIPCEFAVTLVTRSNFDDDPARVLGSEAHSGMNWDIEPTRIAALVEQATQALAEGRVR